jgi:CubicO group peptidase (beta-lactamase class C family)
VLETPLIYEPGTSWTYSHSIDWAGVLVERISDLSLEEYFQTYIFKPCGITSMTFYPTDKIKSNKMAVCYRDGSGKVVATPGGFGMGRPESGVPKLHLGGAGLFGTQRDYLTFLRAVLQCDPKNKEYRGTNGPSKPLISPESYAELFKPSVSVGAGLDGTEKIMEMVSKPKYFDPPATKHNLNHSVGFLLNLEDWTGRRKAGSGCWSGAAKTQFWIDPVTGVAVSLRFETIADEEGICGTQLLAPSPDRWYETYVQYEKVLYENLASQ